MHHEGMENNMPWCRQASIVL